MRIVEEIISALKTDASVDEVRVGPFWTAVCSRHCGLASTTFVHDHSSGPPVSDAGFLTGRSALELCGYVSSGSLLEATIGVAAVNSLIDVDLQWCREVNAADVLFERGAGKKVAVVGHFPFVERLRRMASQLWVLERRPQTGDIPASEARRVIPRADVVAITGTALINGTIDELLAMCREDSLVMVLGPSTPLSTVWFDHGVDFVSGTIVTSPDTVLRFVSEGVVFSQLHGRGVRLLTMSKERP